MNATPTQEFRKEGERGSVTSHNVQPVPGLSHIEVGLLTGGSDRPYVFGLATALEAKGVWLDIIGSDAVYFPELDAPPRLKFLNLRGNFQEPANLRAKVTRILSYYGRLLSYAASAKPRIFHILWNNKFQAFDRTLLMLYYKILGKKIAFTAHNINAGKRDGNDSLVNRLTLKAQYHLADHIFVHTEKMKHELLGDFRVHAEAISVIPFGINNSVADTELTRAEAKTRLGIGKDDRTILFFGRIGAYKGLEYLVTAFQQIAPKHPSYRLVIVGEPKRGSESYLQEIQTSIANDPSHSRIIQKIEFVPDRDTELYFKAADVLALPYTEVFQSGVLFLSYNFGLPVVAADVGSFREDVVEGRTGFVCRSRDAHDLARVLETYFESELFQNLTDRHREIQNYAAERHSWDLVSNITRKVYEDLLSSRSNGSVSRT